MCRRLAIGVATVGAVVATVARADLIVTLAPRDADMNPVTGGASSGRRMAVDILLSVDGEDNPLPDLRFLQLDFGETGSTIELGAFQWLVDLNVYDFRSDELPVPSATSLPFTSRPELITVDEEPLLVATIEVTVNAGGTLNAVGATGIAQTTRARFDAGAVIPTVFSLLGGNLRGGTVELMGPDPGLPGAIDGDGTGDPAESDSDAATDEVETLAPPDAAQMPGGSEDTLDDLPQRDPSAPPPVGGGFCGLAMPGTVLFILMGMTVVSYRRHRVRSQS